MEIPRSLAPEDAATRGIAQLLIGRMCFLVSGYAITVMLARGLGPAAYGIYGLIMSLLLWVESASALGIPRAAMTLIPAADRPGTIAAAVRTLLVGVSLIIFALGWAFAPAVAAFFGIPDGAYLLRLAIIDVPLNGLFLAYQGTLNGQRKFAAVSVGYAVYGLTKLAAVSSLAMLGFSIRAALIANILATVGVLTYLVTRESPRVSFPAGELTRTIVRVALPWSMITASLDLLFAAHLWILKELSIVSDSVIGFYVAALTIARLPAVVASIVAGVLLTHLAAALGRGDRSLAERHLGHAIRIATLILLPAAAVGAVHATDIMTLVYSGVYSEGGPYLAVLLSAFSLYALLAIAIHALMAAEAYRSVALLLSVSVVGGLLLAIDITSDFGALGAATAFAITILLATVAAAVFVRRRIRLSIPLASIARIVGCTVLVTVVGALVSSSGLGLIMELAILAVLYVGALLFLGELESEYASFVAYRRQRKAFGEHQL